MRNPHKKARSLAALGVLAATMVSGDAAAAAGNPTTVAPAATPLERRDGFVDAGGVMIYFVSIGTGQPVMVLHGGPGSTHDGNLKGFDFTSALRSLSIPTLIIYGDHDLLTPATAQQSHAAIANSQLVELRDAAHMTFVDQPVAFFDALSAFLK